MIDDLLLKYASVALANSEKFISLEYNNFPQNYTEEDKVKSEFIKIHSYYHDKNINESYFDSNQDYVIQEALEEIKNLIYQKEYEIAEYYIVSLQLIIGMEIKFNKIIYNMIQNSMMISDFVDKEKYYGIAKPYTDSKGI